MILHLHIKIVNKNILYKFISSMILHLHIKIVNENIFYKFVISMVLHLHIKIVNENIFYNIKNDVPCIYLNFSCVSQFKYLLNLNMMYHIF
jgi:hypothetical protein